MEDDPLKPVTKLYTQLAGVYHAMYASIFDYRREFRTFHRILKKHGAKIVLELGCGTGNLAKFFLESGYDYTGIDIAKPMLRIAHEQTPKARFIHGDMRRFKLARKFDAVIIGGRSFAYMTTNADVRNALASIARSLRPDGVLIFDVFDAGKIFVSLDQPLRDRVQIGARTITRNSTRSMNLTTGWTWNWDAEYVIEDPERKRIIHDRSVLRAFTRDELRLFLTLAGFTRTQIRRGPSTLLAIASF